MSCRPTPHYAMLYLMGQAVVAAAAAAGGVGVEVEVGAVVAAMMAIVAWRALAEDQK